LAPDRAALPHRAVPDQQQETDMDQNVFAQWESTTKTVVESGKRLEALNLKLVEKLLHKQLELINGAVDIGSRAMALYGEGKALPEILAEQTRLATEYGNKWLAATRELTEIVAATRGDYSEWFEEGMKTFTEQAREAGATIVPDLQKRKAA
jgi:phasin family protein